MPPLIKSKMLLPRHLSHLLPIKHDCVRLDLTLMIYRYSFVVRTENLTIKVRKGYLCFGRLISAFPSSSPPTRRTYAFFILYVTHGLYINVVSRPNGKVHDRYVFLDVRPNSVVDNSFLHGVPCR